MENTEIESIAQELDIIYGALSRIEAEIEDELDGDPEFDDWDDEYSSFGDDDEFDEELLDEAIKRVRVVRQGKRMIKYKSTKPGYRVQMVNGRPREVRMKPTETRRRKKAMRRAVRKRRSKKASIARKQKRSMRKRTGSMKRRR